MLKKLNIILLSGLMVFGVNVCSYAEDDFDEGVFEEYDDFEYTEPIVNDDFEQVTVNDTESADKVSAKALDDYDASGSLFEKITMLEQEKVVVQLEKERAQLDLELDRLNAERIKLQMELDTLSGRAEQQQQELESAKRQLEIQTERLMRQKDEIPEEPVIIKQKQQPKREEVDISKKYKLINVVGVDNQLQATVEEMATGQNKRISVGKELDGYVVKSISLNDGIIFEKDGETESLNIGK